MEHRDATESLIGACYREFAPHPAVRDVVRRLFSFTARAETVRPARQMTFEARFAEGDRFRAPLFADASASIVFDLGTVAHLDGQWSDSSTARGGKVIGPIRHVADDLRSELPAMVGAYLHPGQLAAVSRMPCIDVTDRVIDIEDLWGVGARDLAEQLATSDEMDRIDLLESVLLRHLARPCTRGSTVDVNGLARLVQQRGGRVSVDSLANDAGVSRQHLARVFSERIGVSPKLYCRLARFESALMHTRAGVGADWARVACELGYADQSHMIAEFREFSSLTPHMLATGGWFHPFVVRARTHSAARER